MVSRGQATYNEWAPAVVVWTHSDGTITLTADGAGPGGVDRDRADPQRIRHAAVTPADPAPAPAPAPAPRGTGVQFCVGENVEYFSQSFDEWIDATVQRLHSDGAVTLDVKEYADPAKIRRVTSAAPSSRLSAFSARRSSTVHGRLLERFMEITGGDETTARCTLQSVDWDLQRAIDRHLEAEPEGEPELTRAIRWL